MVHTDHGRAGPLLGLPQWSAALGTHGVDACLSAGGKDVGHLLALSGEAGHGAGHAVFQVIGMGDDCYGSLPVLWYRFPHETLLIGQLTIGQAARVFVALGADRPTNPDPSGRRPAPVRRVGGTRRSADPYRSR